MRFNRLTLVVAGLLVSAAATAEQPPLSVGELRGCATTIQQLRSEAFRLVEQSPRNDRKRDTINARTAALRQERAQLPADDLRAGLDFKTRNDAHRAETMAFNQEMARYRADVVAVNGLKARYDQQCAFRPYRRADLDALAPGERQAMLTGLNDVSIPYLDYSNSTTATD